MLTEKGISQAKPKEKLYRLSDNTGNGLSLEVSPEGGKRWRFRYRFRGKAKMISLGTYPLVSLKDARSKAIDAKKELESGVEPGTKKKAAQGAKTFQEVAKEWFGRFSATTTPRYSAEVWSRLERGVFPFIGNKPLTDIDAPTVLSVLRRTEDRGVIITTHKIKSHISQIFKYAIACGLAYADPSRDLSAALRSRASKPMPSIIEPKEVGKLMLAINEYTGPIVRSALLLGALTFVRPGELRTAEWTEFDMEASEWRIPAAKMKMKRPHIVPLSTQALEILSKLQSITGHSPYLFPSTRTTSRPMSDMTVNVALRALGYAQGEITGHGFRAMASSLLAEKGWSVDAIERQLAHVEGNKIRAAYHRSEHLEERRKMMQDWANYLNTLREQAGTPVSASAS
ncbi:MAG: tyrosine-type recombinase/integrase [Desulfovibrio sp.]|jgi:integrase|nr:tyrosine-type recombinase/integrase [Desulfovibrio sp.]